MTRQDIALLIIGLIIALPLAHRLVQQFKLEMMRKLHRSEQGAEGLEKLLIVAAIVLPLLGLLVVFRGAISEWVTDTWGEVRDDAGDYTTPQLP